MKLFLSFLIAFSMALPAYAQQNDGESKSIGPRRQMATIIFAGLGGAVLGLSTLSFYGRPQDKLANIAIGFAIGLIGGTIYVTYRMASEPDRYYGSELESIVPVNQELLASQAGDIRVNLLDVSF